MRTLHDLIPYAKQHILEAYEGSTVLDILFDVRDVEVYASTRVARVYAILAHPSIVQRCVDILPSRPHIVMCAPQNMSNESARIIAAHVASDPVNVVWISADRAFFTRETFKCTVQSVRHMMTDGAMLYVFGLDSAIARQHASTNRIRSDWKSNYTASLMHNRPTLSRSDVMSVCQSQSMTAVQCIGADRLLRDIGTNLLPHDAALAQIFYLACFEARPRFAPPGMGLN